MSNSELITIGAFARDCGLTPSALRFYADCGLLVPATVDPVSGYRYYAAAQRDRAVLIRRLRELDMSLERVVTVLDANPADAARLIDDHVEGLADRVHEARRIAGDINASVAGESSGGSVGMRGITFATAVEQVVAATAVGPEFPVLTGMLIEVSAESMVLTATDRYRLSSRTLVPSAPPQTQWARVVNADDLRLMTSWMRRQHELTIADGKHSVRITGDNADIHSCRVNDEEFPDYRMVFSALTEHRTRVVVSRPAILAAIETQPGRRVRLDITPDAIIFSCSVGERGELSAEVTGDPTVIFFDTRTLYPSISTAIGSEVMLDITATDQPVVIRSADIGDLTTLAMPVTSGKGMGK